MNAYERALMDAPSVPRQPYCPVCGKAAPLTEHHVIARSQGGEDGPTIYLCGHGTAGCHGLAEDERLHFDYDADGWFFHEFDKPTKHRDPLSIDEWHPLSIYDENRDAPSPEEMDAEDGEFLADAEVSVLRYQGTANAPSYYSSHVLKAVLEVFTKHYEPREARRRLTEWASELTDANGNRRPIAPSTLSKMLAGAELPEIPSVLELSVAERYRLKRALDTHKESFEQTIEDLFLLSRDDFDARYFGRVPAIEKPRHECPVCGQVHAVRGDAHES